MAEPSIRTSVCQTNCLRNPTGQLFFTLLASFIQVASISNICSNYDQIHAQKFLLNNKSLVSRITSSLFCTKLCKLHIFFDYKK